MPIWKEKFTYSRLEIVTFYSSSNNLLRKEFEQKQPEMM